jgi:hypothetical protein
MPSLTHTPSTNDFDLEASRRRYPTQITLYGLQTEKECEEGEQVFQDIEDWLTDELTRDVVVHRADAIGMIFVAFESDVDSVHFKLTWADHKMVVKTAS